VGLAVHWQAKRLELGLLNNHGMRPTHLCRKDNWLWRNQQTRLNSPVILLGRGLDGGLGGRLRRRGLLLLLLLLLTLLFDNHFELATNLLLEITVRLLQEFVLVLGRFLHVSLRLLLALLEQPVFLPLLVSLLLFPRGYGNGVVGLIVTGVAIAFLDSPVAVLLEHLLDILLGEKVLDHAVFKLGDRRGLQLDHLCDCVRLVHDLLLLGRQAGEHAS